MLEAEEGMEGRTEGTQGLSTALCEHAKVVDFEGEDRIV